jgi:hypothetical protein
MKNIGQIQSMSINITQPLTFKIDKIEFNKLCLIVGQNGAGKTLMLKMNWCFSWIANYFPVSAITNTEIDFKKEFQLVMDKSFDDQNFDGKIEVFFENATIVAEFKNGEVVMLDYNADEGVIPNNLPTFMSKETRTFDTFVKYMKMKKALGIKSTFSTFTPEEMKKVSDIYKIYDLIFIERMLESIDCHMLDKDLKEALKKMFNIKHEIDQIIVDYIDCELYGVNLSTNKRFKLTTLSAGEQSIINMTLASKLL